MRVQLTDRDKVKRVVVQEVRELDVVLTLNPREAMLIKNLIGNIWGDLGGSQTREFTDSLYWRLAELGVPGLYKAAFSFVHDGIKARGDLNCQLLSEGECARRFAANRDYINGERDAGRLVQSYLFPYSGCSGE